MSNISIKTISQLEPLEAADLNGSDLFQVSHVEDTGYSSKSITFDNMMAGIDEQVKEYISEEFDIPTGTVQGFNDPSFSMATMISRIYDLSASSIDLYGVKTFTEIPKITQDLPIGESTERVPNSRTVKRMIQAYSNTIAPESIVHFDPENNNGHTNYSEAAYAAGHEMIWHFDDNTNDSSEFIVDRSTTTPVREGYIECKEDGWLVAYGWLTDPGNVLPQEAWVGLFGKIKVVNQNNPAATSDNQEERVILLQAQPWVVGKKSSTMQYVSFGVPVKKGLKLKIKTGFKVSGNSSGLQHSNSLLFNQSGMMPNTFVGYIIFNQ